MKKTSSLHLLIPFLLIPSFLFAQVPQGIPYQAMIRNSDGSALMNTNVTVRFTLHQSTTTGAVEYQETQALVTNAFGLINAVFGQGTAVQGTFAAINWSNATKFIQVEANDGNGYVDMGTQQMMSVPYAMHSGNGFSNVSATGDTLYLANGNFIIIPGISAVNNNGVVLGCTNPDACNFNSSATQNNGSCIFPTIEVCDNVDNDCDSNVDENCISTNYTNIPCSFAMQLQNGIVFYPDTLTNFITGNLNSSYEQGVFFKPPSDLGYFDPAYSGIGISNVTIDNITFGNGQPLTSLGLSYSCDGGNCIFPAGQTKCFSVSGIPAMSGVFNLKIHATINGSMFGISIPVQYIFSGYKIIILNSLPTQINGCLDNSACNYNSSATWNDDALCDYFNTSCNDGLSSTINDNINQNCECSGVPIIMGCMDAQACNYSATANADDSSCLFATSICDDGLSSTINDIITQDCICSGIAIVQGCTDSQACNYSSSANLSDSSCIYVASPCDDGNTNTILDVYDANCQCAGTSTSVNVIIGQDYQGGKVAYIFQLGDAGYVVGETHGLIAAAEDLPLAYKWGCYGFGISGADGLAIGNGAQNTLDIVNAGCVGAAPECANLVLNGYSDWFLPSLHELGQLYNNRATIGGFQNLEYWSSTETNSQSARSFNFGSGYSNYNYKDTYGYVRAVRAF